MPIDSEFRSASEAAHYWPNGIAQVARYIQHGTVASVEIAYELLVHLLQPGYKMHADLLRELMDKLTDVSDGPVKWEHGRGLSGVCRVPAAVFPHRWFSAHEAALEITYLTLNQVIQPLSEIADPAEHWYRARQLLAKWGVKPGDIYVIPCETCKTAEHRLACGDSTKPKDVARVMGGKRISALELDKIPDGTPDCRLQVV